MIQKLNFKKYKFPEAKQEGKKGILIYAHNIKMERAILKYYIALTKNLWIGTLYSSSAGKNPELRNYNQKCTILNTPGACFCTKCAKSARLDAIIYCLLGISPFTEPGWQWVFYSSSNKLNRNHHTRRSTSFELRGMLAKSRRNHPHNTIPNFYLFQQCFPRSIFLAHITEVIFKNSFISYDFFQKLFNMTLAWLDLPFFSVSVGFWGRFFVCFGWFNAFCFGFGWLVFWKWAFCGEKNKSALDFLLSHSTTDWFPTVDLRHWAICI